MCCVLMIYCRLSVSVRPSAQSMGEGGWLHPWVQPLDIKSSGLHPCPAGAHCLLQPEVRGIDTGTAQVTPESTLYRYDSQADCMVLWIRFNISSYLDLGFLLMDGIHVPSSWCSVCWAGLGGKVGPFSGLAVWNGVDDPSGQPPSVTVVLAVPDLDTD